MQANCVESRIQRLQGSRRQTLRLPYSSWLLFCMYMARHHVRLRRRKDRSMSALSRVRSPTICSYCLAQCHLPRPLPTTGRVVDIVATQGLRVLLVNRQEAFFTCDDDEEQHSIFDVCDKDKRPLHRANLTLILHAHGDVRFMTVRFLGVFFGADFSSVEI